MSKGPSGLTDKLAKVTANILGALWWVFYMRFLISPKSLTELGLAHPSLLY